MTLLKRLINSAVAVFMVMTLAIPVAVTLDTYNQVYAQDKTAACEGIKLTGAACTGDDAKSKLGGIVEAVTDFLSVLVGALSVIMIIIGGFKYITSSGDSSKVASAKSTIIYAIVGLLIVVFAQVIVSIAINTSTGTATTTTTPPAPDPAP